MARVTPGVNDLYTWCNNSGDEGKRILSNWVGALEDKTPIDIKKISFGSNKLVYWKCNKGHYWTESVNSRTNQLKGCPVCSGKRIVQGYNDLETWCKENNMEYLISEWVGLDENNNVISINQVSYGMKKRVQWKCKYGHKWCVGILNRTRHRSKCPICVNKGIKGKDDLLTWCKNDAERGQKIINEWTGITESEHIINIDEIKPKSTTILKWKCKYGHEWYTQLAHRTLHKTDCPYCANRSIDIGFNDLESYCIKNNLEYLIDEWVGLSENNETVCIQNFSYGSGKRIWWKCKHKHKWIAAITSRVSGTGCPYCTSKGTSYPEQLIFNTLKQIYPDAINRFKANKCKDNPHGVEYDIFITSIKTCIE